jgi:hypothetical protein
MLTFLEFLLTASGVVLLAAIVGSVLDKEGKWGGIFTKTSLITTKISSIILALFVIIVTHQTTSGILAFSTIGVYLACIGIIFTSGKELFGNSQMVSNMAAIAAHKATQIQEDIAKQASRLAEEAKKKEEKKPV